MFPVDVAALRLALSSGETFEYRYFWGHTPREDGALSDAMFSQWYHAPFTLEGVQYPTAEHYMMAAKAALFGDAASWAQIIAAETPADAKKLGRGVIGFDAARWRDSAFGIVTRGNVAKFSAQPALAEYLRDTGDAILVEASPDDRIWGIGLAADQAEARDPRAWKGENLLGFAIMEARRILAS